VFGAEWDLFLVFTSALAAATLLPGGSEAVLAVAAGADSAPTLVLLAVATVGNTLGGMTSWAIGALLPQRKDTSVRMTLALKRVQRYGPPTLLLSWVPIIGDPLCVAAGWVRIGWPWAMAYMAVGKCARYALLLWLL
jgi:membrane protein YqaA with SNARE-associated domain